MVKIKNAGLQPLNERAHLQKEQEQLNKQLSRVKIRLRALGGLEIETLPN